MFFVTREVAPWRLVDRCGSWCCNCGFHTRLPTHWGQNGHPPPPQPGGVSLGEARGSKHQEARGDNRQYDQEERDTIC